MNRDDIALEFMLRLVPSTHVPAAAAAIAYDMADAFLAQKSASTTLRAPTQSTQHPRTHTAKRVDLELADEIPF